MSYRTIKSKAHAQAKRETRPRCQCGTYLRPKTVHYYFNAYGERTPICDKCAALVKDDLEIIW